MANSGAKTVGQSILSTKLLTITDDQIKTLPSIPIEIVPQADIGNGRAAAVVLAIGRANFSAGAYDNVSSDGDMGIGWGDNVANASAFIPIDNLFTAGQDRTFIIPPNPGLPGTSPPTTSAIGQKLTLSVDNTLGGFTGGNPLNTIKITIYYVIVDIS